MPSSFFINALAAGKRSWLIVNQLSKYPVKPDLVIAHNPAAFWPAFVLSNKLGIPYAIDIEDYHPGEFTEERKSSIMEALMGKALPGAAYISFASGSIKDLALRHFTGVKKSLVIDNCFEQSEFINSTAGVAIGGKLRLTWFSQNINFSRGLEKVIPVLQQFATEIEVTLIGNLKEEFKTFLRPYLSFVKIVNPLSQVALHSFLKDFDIGLAIEPGKDINNNIALSNKIWSYFQAGIFILATDTDAQAIFLKQHSDHGELFNIQREDTLTNAIKYVLKNKEQIRQAKHGRYMRAMAYSWEHESIKLANEMAGNTISQLKKILIITPHFPPSNLAAVHRSRLFAQHLPSFGWQPIILAVDEKYYEEEHDENIVKLLPQNLRIEKVNAYKLTKPRLVGDLGIRAFRQLTSKAIELVKNEQIDFLYIPIPSFYIALIGRIVHARTGIPYGIDYIDPWVHVFAGSDKLFSRHWWSTKMSVFLEPIAVKHAALITGVSEGYYKGVIERNPTLKTSAVFAAMPYGGEKADHDKVKQLGLSPYLFTKKKVYCSLCMRALCYLRPTSLCKRYWSR